MEIVKGFGYARLPAVSAALVRFLAKNSGFEEIDTLVTGFATLTREVAEGARLTKEAVESSTATATKFDDWETSDFGSVLERLEWLESQV
jgi:hypothetical protein